MSYLDELGHIFSGVENSRDEEGCAETPLECARRQIDAVRTPYCEGPEGTFRTCGNRHGCGFAEAMAVVDPTTGLATVDIAMNQRISPELMKVTRKLFRRLNASFIVAGLMVDDEGWLHFRPEEPIDLAHGGDLADCLGKGLSTVHAYANVACQLEAGRDPWDILHADKEDDNSSSDSSSDSSDDFLATLRRLMDND